MTQPLDQGPVDYDIPPEQQIISSLEIKVPVSFNKGNSDYFLLLTPPPRNHRLKYSNAVS